MTHLDHLDGVPIVLLYLFCLIIYIYIYHNLGLMSSKLTSRQLVWPAIYFFVRRLTGLLMGPSGPPLALSEKT